MNGGKLPLAHLASYYERDFRFICGLDEGSSQDDSQTQVLRRLSNFCKIMHMTLGFGQFLEDKSVYCSASFTTDLVHHSSYIWDVLCSSFLQIFHLISCSFRLLWVLYLVSLSSGIHVKILNDRTNFTSSILVLTGQ